MASSSRLHKSGIRRNIRPGSTPAPASSEPPPLAEPMKRTQLDLDSRFFPLGIQPGNMIELRGSEGSGKTFLSTYLIARLLFVYPSQGAVLIDTTHHFNLQNLISILSHLDPAILEPAQELVTAQSSGPNPKLLSYLNRLSVIECYTAEQFLLNFGPVTNCPIETLLLTNPSISLLLIDSVDAFGYIPSLSSQPNALPNILSTIRKAVENSRTPVICTLSEYFNRHSGLPFSGSPPDLDSLTTIEIGGCKITSTFKPNTNLDSKYFTHSLLLCPQSGLESHNTTQSTPTDSGNSYNTPTKKIDCVAHLKSKQRSNPGMSAPVPGVNHRVKFSIFSGMLWVCDAEVPK